MSKVFYISKSSIEPKRGPLRIAHLPGEPQPECSYTQRAKSFDSGGRKKLQPSGIAWFWPSSRLLTTCPVSLLGRGKRRKEDEKSTSRVVQVWDSEKLIRFIPASRRLIRIQQA